MAEEVRITDYDVTGGEDDDERVSEWEDGLPTGDDLTPLSQLLISSDLLSAFNITPEPYRSMIDVNRASQNTLSSLRGESEQSSLTGVNGLKSVGYSKRDAMDADGEEAADLTPNCSDYRKLARIGSSGDGYGDGGVETANLTPNGSNHRKLARIGSSGDGGVETPDLIPNGSDYRKLARIGSSGDGGVETVGLVPGGSNYRKLQRIGSSGDGDGDGGGAVDETETETEIEIETETEYDAQGGEASARVSKRQRLVWTPQLHKRFIEVVAHLGVKNAVPKTIMQLMNVEGLTRENVASHLQKYRLYLKRMHGSDSGGSNGYRPVQMSNSQPVHHVQYNTGVQVQQRWYGNGNSSQHGMSANNK